MVGEHERFPQYDFLTHKGYITPTHTEALERHGASSIHRRCFVNVRRVLGENDATDVVDDVVDAGVMEEQT
jgi:ribonuclease HII